MNTRSISSHTLLLLIAATVTVSPFDARAEEPNARPVFRVVFFTPSDIEPPDGVQERLAEHVEYAQMFYGKWMKQWGYLTKASAAMLWKHPLFSGTEKDREITPSVEFEDVSTIYDKDRGEIIIRGKVSSKHAAHSVVVANESDANRSHYWRQCFAERIADDGTFEIAVNELAETDGQLRLVCCFNNGAVVGQDGGQGLQSGFAKQYRFKDGTFTFDEGWATPKPKPERGRRPGPRQP